MKKLLAVISFLSVCSIYAGEPEEELPGEDAQVQEGLPETGYTTPSEAEIANQTNSPMVLQTGDATETILPNQGQQLPTRVINPYAPDESPLVPEHVPTPVEQQELDNLQAKLANQMALLDKGGLTGGLWSRFVNFLGFKSGEVKKYEQFVIQDINQREQVIAELIEVSKKAPLTSAQVSELNTALKAINYQKKAVQDLQDLYTQGKMSPLLRSNYQATFLKLNSFKTVYLPAQYDYLTLDFNNPVVNKQYQDFQTKNPSLILTENALATYISRNQGINDSQAQLNVKFAHALQAEQERISTILSDRLWQNITDPRTGQPVRTISAGSSMSQEAFEPVILKSSDIPEILGGTYEFNWRLTGGSDRFTPQEVQQLNSYVESIKAAARVLKFTNLYKTFQSESLDTGKGGGASLSLFAKYAMKQVLEEKIDQMVTDLEKMTTNQMTESAFENKYGNIEDVSAGLYNLRYVVASRTSILKAIDLMATINPEGAIRENFEQSLSNLRTNFTYGYYDNPNGDDGNLADEALASYVKSANLLTYFKNKPLPTTFDSGLLTYAQKLKQAFESIQDTMSNSSTGNTYVQLAASWQKTVDAIQENLMPVLEKQLKYFPDSSELKQIVASLKGTLAGRLTIPTRQPEFLPPSQELPAGLNTLGGRLDALQKAYQGISATSAVNQNAFVHLAKDITDEAALNVQNILTTDNEVSLLNLIVIKKYSDALVKTTMLVEALRLFAISPNQKINQEKQKELAYVYTDASPSVKKAVTFFDTVVRQKLMSISQKATGDRETVIEYALNDINQLKGLLF